MTLARTVGCIVCSHGEAVLVCWARSGLVFRQLREMCARKLHKLVRRHARVVRTAVVRLGDECARLSFERRGAVLCTDPPASVWTSVANCCSLRLVVAEPCAWAGARRVARCNSFEIQTARSVCSAVRTVLRKDAHQMHAAVDSGCDENVHRMCELPNYGRVLVATAVMALWRRSGDGRTLRTHAPLAMKRRTHTFLFFRWSGGISVNCQREISHNRTSGARGCTSMSRAFELTRWRGGTLRVAWAGSKVRLFE